ncbi:MAG: hypothetical protein JO283_00565, partial [Bradyrhizobium sp.]|nr:hypothetical protein [Bradyrhizobium sp.]
VATRAGFAGFGLGAATTVVGSCVPPGCVAAGAASPGDGVSPVAGGGEAGAGGAAAFGAGASLAAGGGDAGAAGAEASLPGDGAVCAKAPTQSDEIRKDVEASKRGRNDTEAPWQTNVRDAS